MVQIFVKVNGSKATPMEVNLTDDKVEDVMRRIQKDEDAYVTMQGKVLGTSEKLKSCGVTDGCTIQVTSRMRGGGQHKDKKSKEGEEAGRATARRDVCDGVRANEVDNGKRQHVAVHRGRKATSGGGGGQGEEDDGRHGEASDG